MTVPLEHHPVEGYDFMPSEWCGACEHCISYPVPTVCAVCSYTSGGPGEPVEWPCEFAPARPASGETT